MTEYTATGRQYVGPQRQLEIFRALDVWFENHHPRSAYVVPVVYGEDAFALAKVIRSGGFDVQVEGAPAPDSATTCGPDPYWIQNASQGAMCPRLVITVKMAARQCP